MEVVQKLVKGGIVAASVLLCDSSQVNHLLPCRVAVLGLGLEERNGRERRRKKGRERRKKKGRERGDGQECGWGE